MMKLVGQSKESTKKKQYICTKFFNLLTLSETELIESRHATFRYITHGIAT